MTDLNTALRLSLESDTYEIIQSIDMLADRVRNLHLLTEDEWTDLFHSVMNLHNAAQFARQKKDG